MKKEKIKIIKKISSKEEALELYKDMKQAYLEFRLSSKQTKINDYVSRKNAIKKNIARSLTYLSNLMIKENN